jgi:hypothetical protein
MHYRYPETAVNVEVLSLLVIFGCVDSSNSENFHYGSIATTANALASLVVSVLYFYLWMKLRKSHLGFRQSGNKEVNYLRIRLIVISILNLFCWLPVSSVYLYLIAKNETVSIGPGVHTVSPVIAEPLLILTAVVSVANPVIYTVATKPFFRCVYSMCCCNKKKRPETIEDTEVSSLFTESD